MKPSESNPWWQRRWVVVLGLVAVYVVMARLGLLLALPPEKKATAVWVPSGIALAALLLGGRRLWPGIWLGAFLANLWDFFDPANEFTLAAHVAVSAGIATGSTVQALAGSLLLRRWVGTGSSFERTSNAFAFAGAAMGMCLIAATFGVASLYLGGFAPAKALAFIWWTWWLGDMTGVLTAGSLILAWSRLPTFAWEPRRLVEASFLLVLLGLLGVGVFGLGPFDLHVPTPLAYLTIPVLVWATFRFGLHGATTAIFLISGIAVWGTSQGDGPFAQPTVQASLLLLQVFMGVIAVTALVMAAMLDERRGAEAKVHLWEHIAAHAGWPVVIIDPQDSALHLVNRAFADMHGYTVDELIGSSLADLCAPESRSELPAHRRAIHEKGDHVYESIHLRKDGTRFPCLCHGTAFKDEQGQVRFRAGTFQDLTQFKHAEAVLRESEQQFRRLVDTIPQLAWMARPDGHIFWYNRRWHEYTGTTAEDMEGWGWQSVHDPAALPKVLERWKGSIVSGEPFDMVFPIKGADGRFRPFLTRVNPLRDEAQRILNWFGTNTDISEQKRAEEQLHELNATLESRVAERTAALRANEERFKTLAGDAPVGIFETDVDGNCLFVNARWCAMAGMTPAAALEQGWVAALHPDDRERVFREWSAATAEGREFVSEYRFRTPQGEVTWLSGRAAALPSTDRTSGYIGSLTDITERKLAEEQVKNSLREKETLLKEIHHRVKNNLQIVSTLLDLQSDHTTDRGVLAMFQESRGRVKSMALIHERLYRSQDMTRVNFADYVRQLADDLYQAYNLSDDAITLVLDVNIPPLPIDIAIPCGLLLNELMSNCFKHAFADVATGCVRIGFTRADDGTNVLVVADDGAGFPAATDFRKTESFGMQLVNTLVEQLDGEIDLTTERGTTFTVRFPKAKN